MIIIDRAKSSLAGICVLKERVYSSLVARFVAGRANVSC